MFLKKIGILLLLTATAAGVTIPPTPRRKHKTHKASQSATSAATGTTTFPDGDEMPVTTSSPVDRLLYDRGVKAWENVQTDRALEA